MRKQGKINIKGTLQGNTNTPGQERTPSKEFSFEEVSPSVLANDENTFLEGSGALNIEHKKLFTKGNLGSKINNKNIMKKMIKTPAKINGCTNQKACNYNPFATIDDGKCCTTTSCGCYQ